MYKCLVFIFLLPGVALGANILAVFSVTSYSHQIVYRTLTLELNRRGHSVTIITPNPVRDSSLKNYTEIDASFFYETWNRKMVGKPKDLRLTMYLPEVFLLIFSKISTEICHSYLSMPEVRKLIEGNPKFDLLITEFGLNPCFYGFAKFTDYKHLGIFSFDTNPVVHSNLGSVITASFVPDVNLPFSNRMTFLQRLRVWTYQVFLWALYGYTMRTHDSIARQYFGEDLPHLIDIERNLSAIFLNTHFTLSYPRSDALNSITIGGPAFHLNGYKPKSLPEDIKEFMDGATDGVIYFSLGTNVQTSSISAEEEQIIAESFRGLKQRVLWKWDRENSKIDLENVKVQKWFPQVEVLSHPKMKAFVTQGGIQSIGEAVEFHVPMIIMPFFADQGFNARKMETMGVALNVNFDTLTVESFKRDLHEIVYNKTYKENMIKYSQMVRDQPMKPLDKAVWWTEYVLRHKGAPHLRSAATTLPWYQYFLLDVAAFLLLVLAIIGLVIYFLAKLITKKIYRMVRPKTE